ncbi:hypothetical protein CDAR_211 [Caerostris darwini]|uniref:Uncharacterized protein n=1 Tax=Caerostris darwini TaxID=1538125 RepID=A0AAV4TM62_9ARAC|nr:hypothetical protein CDAR_211 [Caerostris darwini]
MRTILSGFRKEPSAEHQTNESVTTGEEAAPVDSKKNQSKSSLKSNHSGEFGISVTTTDSAPAHHQTELNIFISTNSHKSITNQPVPQIPKSSNSYLLDNEPTVLRLILRDTDECRFRAEPSRSSITSRHAGFYFAGMLRVKKVGLTP